MNKSRACLAAVIAVSLVGTASAMVFKEDFDGGNGSWTGNTALNGTNGWDPVSPEGTAWETTGRREALSARAVRSPPAAPATAAWRCRISGSARS